MLMCLMIYEICMDKVIIFLYKVRLRLELWIHLVWFKLSFYGTAILCKCCVADMSKVSLCHREVLRWAGGES